MSELERRGRGEVGSEGVRGKWLFESGEHLSEFFDKRWSESGKHLSKLAVHLSASDAQAFTSFFPCSFINTFFFNPLLPSIPYTLTPHLPSSRLFTCERVCEEWIQPLCRRKLCH